MHVQPTHALAASSTVVGIALILLLANAHFLGTSAQQAAVYDAASVYAGAVVIDENAASTASAIGE